jgi:hypothetical protein
MRKIFLSIYFVLSACLGYGNLDLITQPSQITEEFLTSGPCSYYTDHVPCFKRVFNKMHVRTFLEFGLGYSTKFFMDHCDQVVSVEIITPGTGPEWMKHCLGLYRDCKNWIPIAFFSGKGLDTNWASHKFIARRGVYDAAAYQPPNKAHYALIDSSYLEDLDRFVKEQLSKHQIDIAFVDSGVYIRGDLVQTCLNNQIPIVAAHDISNRTNRDPNEPCLYGYNWIVVPDNYIEIHINRGMGTAFWIIKEDKYLEVIKELQEYVL